MLLKRTILVVDKFIMHNNDGKYLNEREFPSLFFMELIDYNILSTLQNLYYKYIGMEVVSGCRIHFVPDIPNFQKFLTKHYF